MAECDGNSHEGRVVRGGKFELRGPKKIVFHLLRGEEKTCIRHPPAENPDRVNNDLVGDGFRYMGVLVRRRRTVLEAEALTAYQFPTARQQHHHRTNNGPNRRKALNFPFEYVTEKRYSIQGQFELWQAVAVVVRVVESLRCVRYALLRQATNAFLSLFASQEGRRFLLVLQDSSASIQPATIAERLRIIRLMCGTSLFPPV
ncbi:hypothetical protein BJY00DRAFT_140135 [Aspergillus carlsbadensis]|nr:hypothetical protein BJY00DRAFT_140135 [Aspergillus carlsbadensis]